MNSADTLPHSRRRNPPRVLQSPSPIRGRRECRARERTRSLVCKNKKHTSLSHHGHAGTPGIPRAMVLTVSFVLAPETGLSCLRHRRDAKHHRQLDISVGISGPHDFAVRGSPVFAKRLRRAKAPLVSRRFASTASRLAFVTIASRPSGETRRGGLLKVICPTTQGRKFFLRGLDSRLSVDLADEIRFLAQLICGGVNRSERQ